MYLIGPIHVWQRHPIILAGRHIKSTKFGYRKRLDEWNRFMYAYAKNGIYDGDYRWSIWQYKDYYSRWFFYNESNTGGKRKCANIFAGRIGWRTFGKQKGFVGGMTVPTAIVKQ